MSKTLTTQQAAFVDEMLSGTSNVALVARAGSGKTSTIIAAVLQYVKKFPRCEITVCAFGKAIRVEIAQKLKDLGLDWRQAQAATTHSMGWGLTKFAFRLTENAIDNDKVKKIIDQMNDPTCRVYGGQVARLVNLAKVEGFGFFDDCHIGDSAAWYRLADHYNVNGFDNTTSMDQVILAAQHVYQRSLELTSVVDYDDMVLFPLVHNLRVKFQRDVIFLDEAQDTSRARRALVRKFLKPAGRLVAVGDDRQAIMGFAGASADALQDLISEMQMEVLPLTVTWRCPRAVVALAQTIVPDIEAAPGAAEGLVSKVDTLPEQVERTDAILCRNVAPLVETAYSLIRRRIPCKVEGREIGDGLKNLLGRWKVSTIPAFMAKLEDYREREVQKALAKGKESKAEQVGDQCDTLKVICEATRQQDPQATLDDVRAFITDLFADDVTGVTTLSTYHRSKGREWQRVFLLQHSSRCPSPWAKKDWEKRQEANLAYVAITRAAGELVFVG